MLRALAAVHAEGGVRAAGRRLGVTHSAVSRHLHDLQDWLGVPLLESANGRRGIRLTPEGEALARSAQDSFSILSQAVATAREGKRANSVTVSTTPSFAVRWLLPRLPDFERRYRWIEVSVLVEQRRRMPMEEGADFSIRMGRGPWPGLICEPILDDLLFPAASPHYVRTARVNPADTDMSGLRLLHDRDPNTAWSQWKKRFGPDGLDIRSGPRFTASDVVLRAAEQGLGVVLARGAFCQDALETGALLRLGGGAAIALPDQHWLVRDQDGRLSKAGQLFWDWLLEAARTDPISR